MLGLQAFFGCSDGCGWCVGARCRLRHTWVLRLGGIGVQAFWLQSSSSLWVSQKQSRLRWLCLQGHALAPSVYPGWLVALSMLGVTLAEPAELTVPALPPPRTKPKASGQKCIEGLAKHETGCHGFMSETKRKRTGESAISAIEAISTRPATFTPEICQGGLRNDLEQHATQF